MMTRTTMKLLIAALMLVTAPFATTLYAGDDGDGGNKTDEFPHRGPGSQSSVIQVSLDASYNLSVAFGLEASEVSINIYKDGVLLFSGVDAVSPGDFAVFNLSSYGSGLYQVVVDCPEAGEYVSETFLIGES